MLSSLMLLTRRLKSTRKPRRYVNQNNSIPLIVLFVILLLQNLAKVNLICFEHS